MNDQRDALHQSFEDALKEFVSLHEENTRHAKKLLSDRLVTTSSGDLVDELDRLLEAEQEALRRIQRAGDALSR